MDTKKLQDQLDELKKDFEEYKKEKEKEADKFKAEIKILSERRINQTMLLPDAIKARHVAEGVRFIRSGIAGDKPTTGETTLQGAAIYYDETNKTLYIWNNTNSAWESEVFT